MIIQQNSLRILMYQYIIMSLDSSRSNHVRDSYYEYVQTTTKRYRCLCWATKIKPYACECWPMVVRCRNAARIGLGVCGLNTSKAHNKQATAMK